MDLMSVGIGAQRQAYGQVHGSYICEEVFAAWLIAFTGLSENGKSLLAQWWLGADSKAYLSRLGGLLRG